MTDAIRLKVMPQFPSKVTGGTGIEVDKEGGEFTVQLDYAEFLPPLAAYVPDTNVVALIWNYATGKFQLVPLTMLGGLSDAPNDGTLYARKSGAWTPPAVGDLSDGQWSTWAPAYAWTTAGSIPATFVTNMARFKAIGKTVHFMVDVTMSAVGTGNANGLLFSLPGTVKPGSQMFAFGREVATTGKMLGGQANSGTQGALSFYDNGSLIAAGVNARFQFGGFYEAA